MHYFRSELAQSGWLEYEGRIPMAVMSEQFDTLSILDFFKSDTLLKLNGNVKSLFLIKISVLSLNLVPLICSKWSNHGRKALTTTEECLALHLVSSGGLGSMRSTKTLNSTESTQLGSQKRLPVLSSFELLRMGYLVLGETWLISMHD